MNNAGTEQALLNLIEVLPKENFEITVALVSKSGVWQDRIPYYCKTIEIEMPDKVRERLLRGGTKANILHEFRHGKILSALKIFAKKIIFYDANAALSVKWQNIKPISEKYDLAVCYTVHDPFLLHYIAYKTEALKKAAFVHNDFSTTSYKLYKYKEINKYEKFYAVSQILRNELSDFIAEDKIQLFHNIVPVNAILEKSREREEENIYGNAQDIILLTIGRLNKQKGIDIAIDCMKMIKKKYGGVKWYVIGGGELGRRLIKKRNAAGLEKDFIFLGAKQNPFMYIKQCDIYVQPSRHEGYCTTVNEARVLCKPIIATDVSGTKEMLEDGVTGIITNCSRMEIYNAICKLIDDKELRLKLSANLSGVVFNEDAQLRDFVSQI